MGTIEQDNTRIPVVSEGASTYLWRNQPMYGAGVGVTVKHTKDTPYFTVEFLGDELRVPVTQARWLAEVLLSVTDRYRERLEAFFESDEGAGTDPAAAGTGGDTAD